MFHLYRHKEGGQYRTLDGISISIISARRLLGLATHTGEKYQCSAVENPALFRRSSDLGHHR